MDRLIAAFSGNMRTNARAHLSVAANVVNVLGLEDVEMLDRRVRALTEPTWQEKFDRVVSLSDFPLLKASVAQQLAFHIDLSASVSFDSMWTETSLVWILSGDTLIYNGTGELVGPNCARVGDKLMNVVRYVMDPVTFVHRRVGAISRNMLAGVTRRLHRRVLVAPSGRYETFNHSVVITTHSDLLAFGLVQDTLGGRVEVNHGPVDVVGRMLRDSHLGFTGDEHAGALLAAATAEVVRIAEHCPSLSAPGGVLLPCGAGELMNLCLAAHPTISYVRQAAAFTHASANGANPVSAAYLRRVADRSVLPTERFSDARTYLREVCSYPAAGHTLVAATHPILWRLQAYWMWLDVSGAGIWVHTAGGMLSGRSHTLEEYGEALSYLYHYWCEADGEYRGYTSFSALGYHMHVNFDELIWMLNLLTVGHCTSRITPLVRLWPFLSPELQAHVRQTQPVKFGHVKPELAAVSGYLPTWDNLAWYGTMADTTAPMLCGQCYEKWVFTDSFSMDVRTVGIVRDATVPIDMPANARVRAVCMKADGASFIDVLLALRNEARERTREMVVGEACYTCTEQPRAAAKECSILYEPSVFFADRTKCSYHAAVCLAAINRECPFIRFRCGCDPQVNGAFIQVLLFDGTSAIVPGSAVLGMSDDEIRSYVRARSHAGDPRLVRFREGWSDSWFATSGTQRGEHRVIVHDVLHDLARAALGLPLDGAVGGFMPVPMLHATSAFEVFSTNAQYAGGLIVCVRRMLGGDRGTLLYGPGRRGNMHAFASPETERVVEANIYWPGDYANVRMVQPATVDIAEAATVYGGTTWLRSTMEGIAINALLDISVGRRELYARALWNHARAREFRVWQPTEDADLDDVAAANFRGMVMSIAEDEMRNRVPSVIGDDVPVEGALSPVTRFRGDMHLSGGAIGMRIVRDRADGRRRRRNRSARIAERNARIFTDFD